PLKQKDVFAKLDKAKNAKATGNAELAYVVFAGRLWHVWNTGARVGAVYYEYVIEGRGVKMYIHSNPQGDIQPVRVRIGSLCLLRWNL
ncbi:hypothetical protein ACP3W2_24950, partial [Salmonella enterica]|uniref:hypothetical protein n=1 Tax=Salmonella enterica TaxID=28901 RepID=UPI003CF6BB3F